MTRLVAVDTETTGVAFYDAAFGATTFSGDRDGGEWYEIPDQSGTLEALLDSATSLIFHNAKFDLQKLQLAQILPRRKRAIHDTEALAHLLDEHQPKRLKVLARKYLGIETDEDTELKAYVRKKSNGINVKADGYAKVPREILVPYAIKDAEYTYRLFEILYPQVAAHADLLELYNLEMDLTWALLDMEADGLGVDESYVEETTKQFAKDILKTEWAIEDITGLKVFYPEKQGQKTPEGHFNLNSPAQIKQYYEGKGVRRESYNASTLRELDDPFGNNLLELRRLKKLHGTYLVPMLAESKGGILHPHTRQHNTRTGRMASGKAER